MSPNPRDVCGVSSSAPRRSCSTDERGTTLDPRRARDDLRAQPRAIYREPGYSRAERFASRTRRGRRPAGARTPPYNLVLGDGSDEALDALAREVGGAIPGAVGAVPEIDDLVAACARLHGVTPGAAGGAGHLRARRRRPAAGARGRFATGGERRPRAARPLVGRVRRRGARRSTSASSARRWTRRATTTSRARTISTQTRSITSRARRTRHAATRDRVLGARTASRCSRRRATAARRRRGSGSAPVYTPPEHRGRRRTRAPSPRSVSAEQLAARPRLLLPLHRPRATRPRTRSTSRSATAASATRSSTPFV